MNRSAILEGKRAVVFAAAGSIGAAVAKEFAAQGADVFLSSHTRTSVEHVAKQITAAGGSAHPATLDALDEAAVDDYLNDIIAQAEGIDVVFNAMGPRASTYGNGKTTTELTIDEFMLPQNTVLRSQFITARAAARHMLTQRSGAIIFLTGGPARAHVPGTTAIGAAFGAIEALTRNMALDLSPSGIRVTCLRTAGMPDTRTIQETMQTRIMTPDQTRAALANLTMLKISPSVTDTAKAAVFLASDHARMMTGTVLNSSAGAVAD